MDLALQAQLNSELLMQVNSFNQRFIHEALGVWDEIGCGDFSTFIDTYVKESWNELVWLN